MRRSKLSFTPMSLRLLLFILLTFVANTVQDDVCSSVNCGQGTCRPTNASLLGFDCDCFSGWKKMEIAPLTYPSCVIPNCTVDFECGNGAPPSSPPPAVPPPLFNLSNPCNLVWCGDGTCVANGTGHICQCNDGSANFLNNTDFACFKQCSLGADCKSSPAPPSSPPGSSGSPRNGITSINATGSTESSNSVCIINDTVSDDNPSVAVDPTTDHACS